jgi:succinoglycan biosynthesis protein ExoO
MHTGSQTAMEIADHCTEQLISVIIAAYRAQNTLDGALLSIAKQSYKNWECIVADDGSQDNTANIVEAWRRKDPRFQLLKLINNTGPSNARNMAIQASKGEWIAILDSDDFFEPRRLENLIGVALHFNINIVFDNQWIFDPTNNSRRRWLPFQDEFFGCFQLERYLYQVSGASKNHWGAAKPIIRRQLLESPPLRYDTDVRYGEDVLFLSQAIYKAQRFGVFGTPGYVYRVSPPTGGNLSADNSDGNLATQRLINSLRHLTGWRGRLWLELRKTNFDLIPWRGALHQAWARRQYCQTAKTILTTPRAWALIFTRILRRFMP